MSLKTSTLLKNTLSNWITAIYAQMEKSKENNYHMRNYLTFVTLTLPAWQIHTDEYIKRHILEGFFKKLKRHTRRRNWVWCAEAQGNGNIHFHIVVDGMLYHSCVKAIWNSVLDTHGYIDRFEKHHGHRDPNSSDIHSLKKVNHIAAYLSKYMTKDDYSNLIVGRLWGCTDALKQLQPFRDEEWGEVFKFVHDQQEVGHNSIYKSDHFYVLKTANIFKALRSYPSLYQSVISHYLDQYSALLKGKSQSDSITS